MLNGLKKGDSILTRGGIYGKIINFQGKNDYKVIIEVGSNIKIAIARTYIVGLAKNNSDSSS